MIKIEFFPLKIYIFVNNFFLNTLKLAFVKKKQKTYSAFTEECAPPVRAIPTLNFFSSGLVFPYPVKYGWPSRPRPSQRLISFFLLYSIDLCIMQPDAFSKIVITLSMSRNSHSDVTAVFTSSQYA